MSRSGSVFPRGGGRTSVQESLTEEGRAHPPAQVATDAIAWMYNQEIAPPDQRP